MRNYGDKAAAGAGHRAPGRAQRSSSARASVGAKEFATFTKRVAVKNPQTWSPDPPVPLQHVLTVSDGKKTLQTYTVQTGIRSIKVVDGHLMLNGKPLNFRGFGTHEDSLDKGFAIDNAPARAADPVGA